MPISDCITVTGGSQSYSGVIRVPSDEGSRIIGVIRDSTFTKSNWHYSKHMCWKHHAIGLDRGAFVDYVKSLATTIIVTDKDTGREYRASVEDFERLSIEDNLGWGQQLFLPLKHWEVIEPDGHKPLQLALWGGRG
ncbi:MAG TPA: hypothetical protein VMX96_07120 [Dehalococcoidia bacterium]|nr:hypothetical protein [Dehalococcoidia bacterium]